MPFQLDSDWVIDVLADQPDALRLLDRLAADGLSMSVVTYMEAYQGTLRELDARAAETKLHLWIESVVVLPFSMPVARRCAQLREVLRQQARRINTRALDLMIAATATAIEHGFILITRNVRDDQDLPDLELYREV